MTDKFKGWYPDYIENEKEREPILKLAKMMTGRAKKKLGFPVPIRVWLKEDKYYNIVKSSFTGNAANKFFNTDMIVKLLDDHKNGKADNSRKIWTIYTFLVWYNVYFENSEFVK